MVGKKGRIGEIDGTCSPPLSPWTLSPATWEVVQVGNLASSCESLLCHHIKRPFLRLH